MINRRAQRAMFEGPSPPGVRPDPADRRSPQQNVYVKVTESFGSGSGIFMLIFPGFVIYFGVKGRQANACMTARFRKGLRSQAEAFARPAWGSTSEAGATESERYAAQHR